MTMRTKKGKNGIPGAFLAIRCVQCGITCAISCVLCSVLLGSPLALSVHPTAGGSCCALCAVLWSVQTSGSRHGVRVCILSSAYLLWGPRKLPASLIPHASDTDHTAHAPPCSHPLLYAQS